MNTCPITYERTKGRYSSSGLKKLSRGIKELKEFPYSAGEQLREAAARADKMSIQGVQPKLSARFLSSESSFMIVDRGGTFILKPQNPLYGELPENEDLTMRLAEMCGVDIPFHGLFYCKDGSLTYFIRRFDRIGKNKKVSIEDFAQLSHNTRDTKYEYSMEKVGDIINKFCTFPALENIKLFRLTLFSFLIGNEDMHLKNFSLIRNNEKIELSPAYDLLNTTIILKNPKEEFALPIGGRKNRLTDKILIDYYGKEKLGLEEKVIKNVLDKIISCIPKWEEFIKISFLSPEMKEKYLNLLRERRERLNT